MDSNITFADGTNRAIGFLGDALPDRLAEPYLSAFRAFHGRIAAAQAALQSATDAWLTYAAVLRELYSLADGDQIDAEGRIHRQLALSLEE